MINYILYKYFSYVNAQICQNEIDKLKKREQENFEYQRAIQFEKEYKKLKEKIKNGMEQFNRERLNEEDTILLKYKNKMRDCENIQNKEMKNLEKQIKEGEINFNQKKEFKPKTNQEIKENFNNWSLEKIDEEIKNLKKSMNENEESYKFKKAEKDKKKIMQLNKVKDKKNIDIEKNKQNEEKKNIKKK